MSNESNRMINQECISDSQLYRWARIGWTRQAFTLVELLVVIAIIALMIAILLPALNGAREAGLKSGTQNMMTALNNATSSFSNDNGSRMPGYFSQSQMGNSANEEAGMSAMENVMLELGGTDVILGRQGDDGVPSVDEDAGIIAIAPFDNTDDNALIININLIGTSGAYFAPDKDFMIAMDHEGGQQTPAGEDENGQHLMPDIVDAFGNPILAWSMDESARGSIDPDADGGADAVYLQFAAEQSDDTPAWFYLMSNNAFYGEDSLTVGEGRRNQRFNSALSEIDETNMPVDENSRVRTLSTLIASPSYYAIPAGETLEDVDIENIYPTRPRGRMIYQSAGRDGVYFGAQDNGWKSNVRGEGADYHVIFGSNYKTAGGDRHTDPDGKKITLDITEEFDDVMSTVN